jgi:hypothetical protein
MESINIQVNPSSYYRFSLLTFLSSLFSVSFKPIIFHYQVEERYGRNLSLAAAAFAKRALRSRVAGMLKDDSSRRQSEDYTEPKDLLVGPSTEGVSF